MRFHDELIDAMDLVEIADDEPLGRHRGAMAEDEVVVDPDIVAAFQEQANGVAADVAGAAGDEEFAWE